MLFASLQGGKVCRSHRVGRNNVIAFPVVDRKAKQIEDLAKMPLSTLYRMRMMAMEQADPAWVEMIEEAALRVYGR